MEITLLAIKWLLVVMVIAGACPLVASLFQFMLIGFHRFKDHYEHVGMTMPRVAVVVPAWNEELVIGATVERLMNMDYPDECLRVYVIDDASTDGTPAVLQEKSHKYFGRVFGIRREKGGEGKAHTLNHGLKTILGEPWAEAILIIDADVIFEKDAVRKMARHLNDPEIGAVTAYIKEGTRPGNFMTRYIGFEYITAQAASRRAQNVLGGLFCMAGGAQLHSRENLEAIGGAIDTSTLAEDTVTTFKTQLTSKRVHFDGNAVVWAEEPDGILGLWKQRLRWARGNVQLSLLYRKIWFRPSQHPVLGSAAFGFIWFSIFLMPLFMIGASASLTALFYIDFPLSWALFRLLWITHAITYIFVTLMSFAIDPDTARHTWIQGLLFPGLVSVAIIIYSCYPPLVESHLAGALAAAGWVPSLSVSKALILFMYAWLAAGMLAAWLTKLIERTRAGRITPLLMYTIGMGPLLCAVTLASYFYELAGAEMKWDKTVKTGKLNV